MFGEKMKFENYLKLKNKIFDFISDEDWRYCILLDAFIYKNFFESLNKTIDALGQDISNDNLEKLLNGIKSKSVEYVESVRTEKDIVKKQENIRLAFSYYGIIEAITEGSFFEKRIVANLKKEYGDSYLQRIEQLDKENPSILTNFTKLKQTDKYRDCDIQYLILKNWQDKQNIYMNEVIDKIVTNIGDEYIKAYDDKYGEFDCISHHKLVLEYLRDYQIISIDTLASLVDIGFGNELATVVGGKAFGLAILKSHHVNIPLSFVVPVEKNPNNKDLEVLDKDYTYAVRSSADCEDGSKFSYAGMFTSYLDTSIEDVSARILDVKKSQENERLQAYIQKFGLKSPKVAVVIQQFIDPEISGVFIGKDKYNGIVEWVSGTGEKLVSGKAIPASIWCKKGKPLMLENIDISTYFLDLQKELGTICDFEWCLKAEKLYMLQYRPVTALVNSVKSIHGNITGTPAASGEITGNVCFLKDDDEIGNFVSGSILLTYYTDPNWIKVMTDAKGIVTAQGGFLCHAAIIARELGIPCITGIGDEKLEFLAKQSEISINGSTGAIEIIKANNKKV